MANQTQPVDLFQVGQEYFDRFIKEFAVYNIQTDPGIELRRGKGMLCYYSLEDRNIYLAVPDLSAPLGKLQALFFRSLLGCESNDELLYFFRLFIPHIIAHELTHHLRHRYGLFGESLWHEEQVANKMSVALVKHRLSPAEKEKARKFLRRGIDTLAKQIEEKNIAVDSYYSVLHALNVSGEVGVSDFENIELLQTTFGLSAEQFLGESGQLPESYAQRLDSRDDIIDEIDEKYTSDQIKYIYYHLGWLYLDLTSRETEYVDEFARNYLNLGVALLPLLPAEPSPTDRALQACYRAYLDAWPHSEVAGRYFYKRYRALLLARLQTVELAVAAQTDRLKREASLILEAWGDQQSDTLDYLAQLAPPQLRNFFPHLIAANLDPELSLPADLPTETDRRLWQVVVRRAEDEAATNTLRRLALLDQTEIYRPLPARVLLELTGKLSLIKVAVGEPLIWQGERNDDVYFLIEGRLEVLVNRHGNEQVVDYISPGQSFGDLAFFTEDPRFATVRAVEPSRCFVLTDADLQLIAYNHPTILMRMAGALAKRLADLYQTSRREAI